MNYHQRMTETAEQAVVIAPGSAEAIVARDRFAALFGVFTPEGVRAAAPDVYAEDIWFNDTLKTVVGLPALTDYLAESAGACERCTVDIDAMVADGVDVYLRWRMGIEFKKFKRGEMTRTIGMTHLRVNSDGRFLLHQDFWDAAQGLYEHIPLVGWVVRKIRARV